MSEVLIHADSVSKKFCRSLKRSLWYGLRDMTTEALGREGSHDTLRRDEFWAVNDVSFKLRRGECLGLIGHNGAGKTTLLKLLNGLIKPDHGSITMRGRVGALIALGAGFNPILSGRENIHINASILGIPKGEIDAKLDEIIAFADIPEFIDSPVQTYSSGMQVRLGFAVATALRPDILLLDEVLAVGDGAFRHKCYHRLQQIMSTSAVILVSHSMDYIAQTCTSVAMMRRGHAELFPSAADGIACYNAESTSSAGASGDASRVEAVYPPIRNVQVRILTSEVVYGARLSVEVWLECENAVPDVVFSFTAVNSNEQSVMAWHTSRRPDQLALRAGRQVLGFHIEPLLLHDGVYRWNFNISRRGSIEHIVWFMRAGAFKVTSRYRSLGDIPYLVDTSSLQLTEAPNDLRP